MERYQHQRDREKANSSENNPHEIGATKSSDQEEHKTEAASPVSPSSSPSHDFSFTISLHSSSTTPIPDKSKNPPPFAIDLSPADEIFFHGHLLPMHLLSHLPSVSPRSSINSMDSFTLPIRELLNDQIPNKDNTHLSNDNNSSIRMDQYQNNEPCYQKQNNLRETNARSKSKPFSLFGFLRKGSPESDDGKEKQEREEQQEKHKRKVKFDMSGSIKRYLRMVRPLILFRWRRVGNRFQRQAYSFSGSLSSLRNKKELMRGRRGEYSAPASMRTSPTNSGLLLATATFPSPSDSTMEELQAAIQAAIAHCKNSIATDQEKLNAS